MKTKFCFVRYLSWERNNMKSCWSQTFIWSCSCHNIFYFSTKILTADNEIRPKENRKGKGRQGAKKVTKPKKKSRDPIETADESHHRFKDSTVSTSSLSESGDSEWRSPVEETKTTPKRSHHSKKPISEIPVPKGVKRKAKQARKEGVTVRTPHRYAKFDTKIVTEAKL